MNGQSPAEKLSPIAPMDDRAIASSMLTLCGFTAYVEPIPNNVASRVDLVRIPKLADEPLEVIFRYYLKLRYYLLSPILRYYFKIILLDIT